MRSSMAGPTSAFEPTLLSATSLQSAAVTSDEEPSVEFLRKLSEGHFPASPDEDDRDYCDRVHPGWQNAVPAGERLRRAP